jgi:hypothetical protein
VSHKKHEPPAEPVPVVIDAPVPDVADDAAHPFAPAVVEPEHDVTGKAAQPAAPSGAEGADTPGIAPLGQGAQVVLTGDAQAAARGGTHDDIQSNTVARDAAIAGGHVAEGATADAAADATAGHLAANDDPAAEPAP